MNFLSSWLQGIVVSVIIATIVEMIVPSGNSKKYIKVVLGLYIVFNIITPVINEISNNNFELSSIVNIDEYTKKMQTYEASSQNINMEETNELTIKQIYVSKLEKDIKSKLEEKEYIVEEVKVEVEEDDEYKIKSIKIKIEKDINENKTEESQNLIKINEVKSINIQVSNQIDTKQTEEKSKISDNDKKNVKEYLSSVYEINEKQITVY